MATLQADSLQVLLKRLGVEDAVNSFPSADVLARPLDIYRVHLAEVLVQLTECGPQVAYDSIQEPNDYGDLEVVIPRLRLKGSKPKDLAIELAQKFPETPLFDPPFEDGIHLRLFLSPENLARILLPYILDRATSYGCISPPRLTGSDDPADTRRRVLVEFSSPNLGKAFDGAHLRSTIIGSSIASLYDGMGWDVCRMNFLGDWGKHIGLLAVGWSRFGSDELFEVEPLRHLLTIYTKIEELSKDERTAAKQTQTKVENGGEIAINEDVPISAEQDDFFKKMEVGDSDAVALWKRFREICVSEYAKLYAQLGVTFDDYSGESEVSQATIAEVEAILTEKRVYEETNGTWIIDFKKHGPKGLGTVTARHANGTTSYLLRDVGAVLERIKKYHFDKMIYVVSAKQDTHFQQLFRTLELMGDEYHEIAQSLQHVNFGKLQGLSPQSGSSGLLFGNILEQCQKTMQESLEADGHDDSFQSNGINGHRTSSSPNELARLALMSQELSTKRSNTLNFTLGTDEKIAAAVDNYPGLAVQRWLDCLWSKFQNAEVRRILDREDLDYTLFGQEEAEAYADMLRLIAHFPNIVSHAFEKLEPSIILTYLLQVIEMLPSVWDEDEDNTGSAETLSEHEDAGEGSASRVEASQSHSALKSVFYECVRTVLENGMNLIGLVPNKERGQDTAAVTAPAITALPTEVSDMATPTAMPQEANEEATPTAIPQALIKETALQTMPREDNDKALAAATPQEAGEGPPLLAMPQEVNEHTTPPALPQEGHDEAVAAAEAQEVDKGPGPITLPREASEEPALPVIPEEVKQAAPTAIPLEATEEPALIAIPQAATEKLRLTAIQQQVDEAAPKAIPQEVNHEDITLIAIPHEADEVPALATTPHELTEAAPTTTNLQRAEEDAMLTAVPVEEPVLTPIPQEVSEAAARGIPQRVTGEDDTVTASRQEAAEEATASTPWPQEVNDDAAESTAIPREMNGDEQQQEPNNLSPPEDMSDEVLIPFHDNITILEDRRQAELA